MNLLIALVCFGADPVVAPWDVEGRIAALEAKDADKERRIATLEAQMKLCPCVQQAQTMQGAPASSAAYTCVNGVCVPMPQAPVGASVQSGVPSAGWAGSYSMPMQGGPFMGGGQCGPGGCGAGMSMGGPMQGGGGGSCGPGGCGPSGGGRGGFHLFGGRRR